jgi:hypothetical protein
LEGDKEVDLDEDGIIAFLIEILDEERGPRDQNHVDKREDSD